MSDRQGVEIDYCPECWGVWLGRGELDKIIERAGPPTAAAARAYEERDTRRRSRDPRDRGDYRKRKKESFLGELFDF